MEINIVNDAIHASLKIVIYKLETPIFVSLKHKLDMNIDQI